MSNTKRKGVAKSTGESARRTTRKPRASGSKRGKKRSARSPGNVAARRVRKESASAKKGPRPVGAGSDTKMVASASPKGLRIGAGGSPSRAEKLRSMLEAKRAEILEEIRRARQDSMEIDRMSFAEVGDLVSASVEKEKAFEYGEIGVNALREINTALEKLKAGTFGICEMCGRQIGLKRLRVMPSARLCIKCKSSEEASGSGGRGR